MNEKCKYCDYVSKCSKFCEYGSFICGIHRSFPKVVDKSYEELKIENQQLKSRLQKRDKMIERLKTYVNFLKVDTPSGFTPFSRTILGEEILKFIDGETEERK